MAHLNVIMYLQAKLIEFNPIRHTDVVLPPQAVFVVSNSCVEINKAATSHFNTRVVECRLAAQVSRSKSNYDLKYLGQSNMGMVLGQGIH